MQIDNIDHPSAETALSQGQLVVIKTDTIYGIIAKASDPEAVNRLYQAKNRNPQKSCIILVADATDIPGLNNVQLAAYLALSSQRPTTLVVEVGDSYLPHLTRQQGTLAFRSIRQGKLHDLISQTGPLLAPSANPEGLPPASNIDQAMDYFGSSVAVYVNSGSVTGATASRIVKLEDQGLTVLRD